MPNGQGERREKQQRSKVREEQRRSHSKDSLSAKKSNLSFFNLHRRTEEDVFVVFTSWRSPERTTQPWTR